MSSAMIPVGQEWADIKNMSQVLLDSRFLPKAVDTPQKACAIILMGRELGVGPMESLSKISVIQGKPTVSAELLKAMVHKKLPSAKFYEKSSDDNQCTMIAARPGDPEKEFTYTIAEATAMGLNSKDNWKKQPKVMLRWRCISQVCRTLFPDCLSGISYTPEEMGAEVNEEGEVIEVAPEKKTEKPAKKNSGPSKNQFAKLGAMCGSYGVEMYEIDGYIALKFGLKSKTELTNDQLNHIYTLLESGRFPKEYLSLQTVTTPDESPHETDIY